MNFRTESKMSDYFVHESSYVDEVRNRPGTNIWHFCPSCAHKDWRAVQIGQNFGIFAGTLGALKIKIRFALPGVE